MMTAMNTQDIDQYRATLQEYVEFVLPGGRSLHGREAVMQHIQSQWRAFPDGHVAARNQIATQDEAATEIVLTGTHTGPLTTPDGEVPPTGRRVEIAFVTVHRVKDGLVASERIYFDQLGFLVQLGLLPNTDSEVT
jgi:steroid delta-isomerase-like uncharacterized protein